jgi:hypothetical protein
MSLRVFMTIFLTYCELDMNYVLVSEVLYQEGGGGKLNWNIQTPNTLMKSHCM